MRYFSLAKVERHSGWFLHPITGNLHKTNPGDLEKVQSKGLPPKVLDALHYCDQPYSLAPPDFELSFETQDVSVQSLEKIYKRTVFFRGMNFWVANQYASLTTPLFSNSLEACFTLSKLNLSALSDLHGCLNRVLAVAKTSIEFKKSGVIMIGADLPQTNLHAWIIEKNYQPDPWDRNWINYIPIAAYAF